MSATRVEDPTTGKQPQSPAASASAATTATPSSAQSATTATPGWGASAAASSAAGRTPAVDARARAALPTADPAVAALWAQLQDLAGADLPVMGLTAGQRPAADVEVLAGVAAAAEYELARRMHAASTAGALPLPGPGTLLTARAWSHRHARRLARAGALASDHPCLARAWATGLITAEHLDAIATHREPLTNDELAEALTQLEPLWGQLSPLAVTRFLTAAARMLHPPTDGPTREETDAYEARTLSFARLGDTVVFTGELPRIEGEALMTAIDALAERLRTAADHLPAATRRADALITLLHTAASAGTLPTRGGLPIALNVTLHHTACGDPIATTSRGHHLTPHEIRFSTCDPTLTPTVLTPTSPPAATPDHSPTSTGPTPTGFTAAQRIAALAATLLDTHQPLAVGRSSRTATPAQRKALTIRDKGCIIPGCPIPADACQVHHLTEWAAGGTTDLDTLALLCWTHHRQVDLDMWRITPTPPRTLPPTPPPTNTPGVPWPANNNAPFTITTTPRHQWRH